MDVLIRAGANLEVKNNSKQTVLHCAAMKGNSNIVQILITNQAKIEAKCCYGVIEDQKYDFVKRGKYKVTKVMKAYETTTPLDLASMYGHEQVVKILLEAKANVDSRIDAFDEEEKDDMKTYEDTDILYLPTALHLAAHYGHDKVVTLLLEAGADVNHTDGVRGEEIFEGRHERCRVQSCVSLYHT